MFCLLANEELRVRTYSVDDVLSPYVYVFYIAYVAALIFTPVMRMIANYYGIIDRPDGVRKMHTSPVAYLGGVAVFLGWLAGLALSQFLALHNRVQPYLVVNFGIVTAACAIVLLGLWDDILGMTAWKKLSGQVCVALCLFTFGVGRKAAFIFIHPILLRTNHYLGWPALENLQQNLIVQCADYVFVILVVLLCCNATNLMDGLDGLCGGVMAVVAGGFLFLAVSLAMTSEAVNDDALRVVLGLALLGAVLAFIPYNFNPASIFMGDTGSMFLGFCCATMMILFAQAAAGKWFMGAMVMFSLPLLDTALAFVRRWVNRRPIFSADRYHFHHQLIARGFTVKQTVMISYGLSLIFCILGAGVVYMKMRYAVGIYLVVFGSVIVAAYKMGMVHERVAAVTRRPLAADSALGVPQGLEPGSVLEVKDESDGAVPAGETPPTTHAA